MRVLELSDREEAAAYCGKLFARWGAHVTRIDPTGRIPASEAERIALHGGKALTSIDLVTPDALDRLRAFAADTDIVVCDLPIARMEALLPALETVPVRVLVTPFGRTGPYRDAPATAATLMALAGHTHLSGDPGRAPLTVPGRYPYYQAGSYAYLVALAEHLSGAAVTVDVSVLEVAAGLHQFTDVMWTFGGVLRSRHGSRWENLCPTSLFPCADGWVALNILQNFWQPFALWIGGPALAEDGRYLTNDDRMERREEVEALVVEAFRDQPMRDLFREGQETWRVPAGYTPSMLDGLDDPHLVAREFWRALPFPGRPGLRVPGSPFRFAGEGLPAERHPDEPNTPAPSTVRGTLRGGTPDRPLAGVRVADFTRIWSGPLATRILGDLGAEVIKVEAPSGRTPRVVPGRGGYWPPGGPGDRPWNRQGLINKLNRNKSSLAIDLKDPRGREAALRLVATCDIVIENFSARAMPSLGLGYDALREANPRVIYLPMPAFGSFGPYRDYVGLGPSIEPLSGLTALMGYGPDEPRVSATAITDPAAGVTAAGALLTALWRRERTGEGALIDLSQGEAMSVYLGEQFVQAQIDGREPPRLGNAHPDVAPHGVYRCAGEDEWIAIAARDEAEWRALDAAASLGWARDPRFATLAARLEHRVALDEAIEAWTAGQEKRALTATLMAAAVPAGAVASAPEWMADPHLQARGYFSLLPMAEAGTWPSDGSPLHFDGTRTYEAWRGAPRLGEHNRPVLTALGYTFTEIEALEADGVLADAPPA
ncbi:MAG: CoA transferase [Dehalococcoidia bacterium]|nr:CoA transferase [Dehalococcoidia bacterium]